MGGVILGLLASRLDVGPPRREGRARILGLEPVHDALDPVDVLRPNVVAPGQRRGDVDMGDVVTGCRIDAIKGLEEHPTLAELLGDGGEVRVALTGETVAQAPFPVSSIGEIESGLAFEHRLSARYPLACQTDSQQRISYRRAFA